MAGNSVDYIIRLVADDSELKQKLTAGELLNKSEMAKIKRLLQSTINSAGKEAKSLGQDLQNGLNVDTTKLENALKFIGGVFDELEKTGNPIKDWAKSGAGVYKAFDNMQTSVQALAQNVGSLTGKLDVLTTNFENFKSAYQSFRPTEFADVADSVRDVTVELERAAKAFNIDIGLSDSEKNIKATLHAMQKALKQASFPEIKINYELDDEKLKKQLAENDYKAPDLESGLNQRFGDLQIEYEDIVEELNQLTEGTEQYKIKSAQLVPVLKEMLLLDARFKKSFKGDSLLSDYSLIDDSGVFDSANNTRKAIKEIMDSLREEVEKTETSLKNIRQKWTDDLSTIDLKLKLTKQDELDFKNAVDQYVQRLNAGEFGEIQPVTIDLVLSESAVGQGKQLSLDEIKEQKEKFVQEEKKINQQITALENEFSQNAAILDGGKASDYKIKRTNARQKQIEAEIGALRKNLVEYQYISAHLDDPDFGAATSASWHKFDAVEKSLSAQQTKILEKTREWKRELENELRFKLKWDAFVDETVWAEQVGNINLFMDKYPVSLVPNMDTFIADIQDALNGHEFTLNISSDGPLTVTGGIVPTAGVMMPMAGQPMVRHSTKKPQRSTSTQPTPAPVVESSVPEIIERTETVIKADTEAIIQFAKDYQEARQKEADRLKSLLDGTGLTSASSDKDFRAYYAGLKDGSIELSVDKAQQFSNVENYITALKNAKKAVDGWSEIFGGAVGNILSEADKIADNPELADSIADTIKQILIDAVAKSIRGLESTVQKQRKANNAKISEGERKYKSAMAAYDSTEEQGKRASAITSAQSEIDSRVASNEVLREYYEVYQEIATLRKKTKFQSEEEKQAWQADVKSWQEYARELESKALPGVRAQYDELLKLIEKRDALYAEDPNNEYLKAAREAQEQVYAYTTRNTNLERRTQAYAHIGIPMEDNEKFGAGAFTILKSEDAEKIGEFIVNTILAKADLVDRMSPGRKFSGGSSVAMFGAGAQREFTSVVDLVQKALGLAQQTARDTARREAEEEMFEYIRDITYKGKSIKTLAQTAIPKQELFDAANQQFADELEAVHQRVKVAEEKAKKENKPAEISERDRAYLRFEQAVSAFADATTDFRTIQSSFSKEDREGFLLSKDKNQFFVDKIVGAYKAIPEGSEIRKKIDNALQITKDSDLSEVLKNSLSSQIAFSESDLKDPVVSMFTTWRNAGLKYGALENTRGEYISSIYGQKENKSKNQEYQYGILTDDIYKEAQKYVFRVSFADDKGNTQVVVYNKNKHAKYKSLQGTNINPKTGAYGWNLFDTIPSDMSNIKEINVFEAPGMKPADIENRFAESGNPALTQLSKPTKKSGHTFAQKATAAKNKIRALTYEDKSESEEFIFTTAADVDNAFNDMITEVEARVNAANDEVARASTALEESSNRFKEVNSTYLTTDKELRKYQSGHDNVPQWKKWKQQQQESVMVSTPEYDVALQELDATQTLLRNVESIVKNPTNTSLWTLVDEIPECIKTLASISEEEAKLNKQQPSTHEEVQAITARLATLSEQKRAARAEANKWLETTKNDVVPAKEKVAQDHIKEAIPKLVEQYQHKIVEMLTEAASIQEQLKLNPENSKELKTKFASISKNIVSLVGRYTTYLSKYNVTTSGPLGNSVSQQSKTLETILKDPMNKAHWGEFDDIYLQTFQDRYDAYEEDRELTQKFHSVSEEEQKQIRARQAHIALLFNSTEKLIREVFAADVAKKSNAGVFAGLNLGDNVSDDLLRAVIDGGSSMVLAGHQDAIDAHSRASAELDIATQAKQQAAEELEIKQRVASEEQEALRLLKERQAIAAKIVATQDEAEKQSLLEQYNKLSGKGSKPKAHATRDPEQVAQDLQEQAWIVINAALDDIEAAREELKTITDENTKAARRLDYLSKEKTDDEERNHYQKQAIASYIDFEATKHIEKETDDYKRILAEAKSYIDTEIAEGRKVIDAKTDSGYDESYQRILQAETKKRLKELVSEQADETAILQQAQQNQIAAMAALNERKESELAYIAKMEEEKSNVMKLAGITQEQIDARRQSVQATREETKIVQQTTRITQNGSATPTRTESGSEPIGEDAYYTNYGEYAGTGTGYYSFDTSGLARQDTLAAIYRLLSGDGSHVGKSEAERRDILAKINEINNEIARRTGDTPLQSDRRSKSFNMDMEMDELHNNIQKYYQDVKDGNRLFREFNFSANGNKVVQGEWGLYDEANWRLVDGSTTHGHMHPNAFMWSSDDIKNIMTAKGQNASYQNEVLYNSTGKYVIENIQAISDKILTKLLKDFETVESAYQNDAITAGVAQEIKQSLLANALPGGDGKGYYNSRLGEEALYDQEDINAIMKYVRLAVEKPDDVDALEELLETIQDDNPLFDPNEYRQQENKLDIYNRRAKPGKTLQSALDKKSKIAFKDVEELVNTMYMPFDTNYDANSVIGQIKAAIKQGKGKSATEQEAIVKEIMPLLQEFLGQANGEFDIYKKASMNAPAELEAKVATTVEEAKQTEEAKQQTVETEKQLENKKAETVEEEKQTSEVTKQAKIFKAWVKQKNDPNAMWAEFQGESTSKSAFEKQLRANGYSISFSALAENWDAELEKHKDLIERQKKTTTSTEQEKPQLKTATLSDGTVISANTDEELQAMLQMMGTAIESAADTIKEQSETIAEEKKEVKEKVSESPQTQQLKAILANGAEISANTKEELQTLATMMGSEISQMVDAVKEEISETEPQTKAKDAEDVTDLINQKAVLQKILEDDDALKSRASDDQGTSGGLLDLVRQLATEATLKNVLNALKTGGGVGGQRVSSESLLQKLQSLANAGTRDKHERVAYVDLSTGSISESGTGEYSAIDTSILNGLRKEFSVAKGYDTQIHTHVESDDTFFSSGDLKKFVVDYQDGIKKQILLTKDNITFLDTSATKSVEEVQEVLNKIAEAGQSVEAIQEAIKDSGVVYESKKFSDISADELAKLLGAKTGKGSKKKFTNALRTEISGINTAKTQRNKLDSLFGETTIAYSDVDAVVQYNKAYNDLLDTYEKYKQDGTLNDADKQKELALASARVQQLGKDAKAALDEVADLTERVNRSGSYTDKAGNVHTLGKISDTLSKDEALPQNMEETMRNYLKTMGLVNVEHVRFDNIHQRLTGTVRTSNSTVAEIAVQYNKANNALFDYQTQEKESLTGMASFMKGMKAKVASIMQYVASITGIHEIISAVRQGIQYIREIDSALTELKKVTDETEESYDRFLDTAAKTADKVGSTIKEIVSSTADWARLGYSMEDAAQLAESTSVLLNVSEFSSIEDATSALTSTMQAFGYVAEDSMHVVDILNEVKFLASLYSDVYDKDGYIGKTLDTDNSEERF